MLFQHQNFNVDNFLQISTLFQCRNCPLSCNKKVLSVIIAAKVVGLCMYNWKQNCMMSTVHAENIHIQYVRMCCVLKITLSTKLLSVTYVLTVVQLSLANYSSNNSVWATPWKIYHLGLLAFLTKIGCSDLLLPLLETTVFVCLFGFFLQLQSYL